MVYGLVCVYFYYFTLCCIAKTIIIEIGLEKETQFCCSIMIFSVNDLHKHPIYFNTGYYSVFIWYLCSSVQKQRKMEGITIKLPWCHDQCLWILNSKT